MLPRQDDPRELGPNPAVPGPNEHGLTVTARRHPRGGRRPLSRKPGRQQAAHPPPLVTAPPPPPLAALLCPRRRPLLGAAPPPPPTCSLFLRPHALAAVFPARSLVNEPQIWCGDQRAAQAGSKGAKGERLSTAARGKAAEQADVPSGRGSNLVSDCGSL